MKEEQYLLTVLMEEAAEIQQAASKTIRFGFDSYYEEGDDDNKTQLLKEFNDLVAVMEMIFPENDLINKEQIENKKHKVKHFIQVSKKLGRL